MAWVRLDDKFYVHSKILAISPVAGWLWVCGLAYCNDHLTRGAIPSRGLSGVAPTVRQPLRYVEELVTAGLWEVTETGWAIHDYHDYQMSPEQILERRDVRAAAGRLGGVRSGETRRSKTEASASISGSKQGSKNELITNPVPVPVPVEEATTLSRSRATTRGPNGFSEESKSILQWFNEKSGKHFQPVAAHLRFIDARLKDHEPWVLRKVVSMKAKDPDFRKWLRPKTVFNETNFANYVGELPPPGANGV